VFAVTASVRVNPGRREDFLETIAHQADTSIKLEPGCLRFEIFESENDPLQFLLVEVFSTPDDYHIAHRETAHYADWAAAAADLLEGERIVTGYRPIRLELEE
jgi:(4S)-4-hydroxy-5-phosphonooxypentane-2,3-dione isomerase